MNIKQYKYVLTLSSTGSFSKAADMLNISQPSLSQYIKKIEKEIGTDLFVRANGEIKLTEAGRVYLDAGKQILALEDQMQNKLVDIAAYKCGTITIGISPYRSIHLVPSLLARFDKLYPNIKLIIKEKYGNDLIESARHGDFDLCVVALPVDEKTFDYELVQKEEVVIAVKKGTELHRVLDSNSEITDARKFPAVDISLVNGYNFAVVSEFLQMHSVTNHLLEKYNISIQEKIILSSNEALLSVVNSGVCASFIPSGLVEGANENVAIFSIRQDFEFRNVAVIHRKDQYLSQPLLDLIQILKQI